MPYESGRTVSTLQSVQTQRISTLALIWGTLDMTAQSL